ncbi:MAG: hypothetical protein E6J62_16690 [Deltaproteobacteria bacterium]|nr:MAG: hypothetical protein E6J61_24105 [Deltaproteobacteria bacterium]TMB29073.1 MAG: hypothetical protein E6J62_16690 [Deltaproteobacteria bacterium]
MALESELTALTNSLRKLHLALIEHTRIAYERVHGSVAGPGELLQLLTRDPEFAWLHPLSELMAWVDELLDPRRDPRPQPEEAAAVRNELSRMLGITHDPTHPFAARYLPVLQDSPHAVMGHAAVREALRSLTAALGSI